MIFRWESENERLRRFMSIPPKKKMEWLRQMREFMRKVSTDKQKEVYWKLRASR